MTDRIHPDPQRPFYWRFRGSTRPLMGGSSEDNLFQQPEVERELDALLAVGGDYVRCTLSSRDPGNAWPFTADLKLNDAYWGRLDRFLALADERGIVVQVELWDRFDFAREPWLDNPFNPMNNRVYTAAGSGLAESYDLHPGRIDHPFFRSVPDLDGNDLLLSYQHAQVDRLLGLALPRGNLLYCMDNETHVSPLWGRYWSLYIKERAAREGVGACTTEMWDDHDLAGPQHANTLDHPETYDFLDVSQNTHQRRQRHWDHLQAMRRRVVDSGKVRPMNNVKVYGCDGGPHGDTCNAVHAFWRNMIGGCASFRFHRPPTGLGLGGLARRHLRAARAVSDAADVTRCTPRQDLLLDRGEDEAYCCADEGRAAAVFFPDGGSVGLRWDGPRRVRWWDFEAEGWRDGGPRLEAPGDGPAAAVVESA